MPSTYKKAVQDYDLGATATGAPMLPMVDPTCLAAWRVPRSCVRLLCEVRRGMPPYQQYYEQGTGCK